LWQQRFITTSIADERIRLCIVEQLFCSIRIALLHLRLLGTNGENILGG